MKIMFITESFGYKSGVLKAAFDILICLLASNKPVAVLSYNNKIKLPKRVDGKEIHQPEWIKVPRKIPFPKQINRKFPKNIVKWIIRGLEDFFNFNYKKKIKKVNPNLIFINALSGHDLYLKYMPEKDVKTIMIVDVSPSTTKSIHSTYVLNRAIEIMEYHTSLIFPTLLVKDEWRAYGNLRNKQSFCISNCANDYKIMKLKLKNKTLVRRHLAIPLDLFIIVCVANIQHGKGQDLIVNNFDKIKKAIPNLLIYFIGMKIFPWGYDLVQQIKLKKIGENLQVLGSRQDALSFIYAADMLVLPTRAEIQGIVILEAMALNTPVVASDVGGIPEMIENGVSGLLIPPDNSEKLVEAFERMYSNAEERRRFADVAYEKYWSNFSRSHQIKRYADMIEEMSGKMEG